MSPNVERFLTWSDRWGRNRGIGRRVLSLDLAECHGRTMSHSCGWRQEADFPGTPRSGATVVSIRGVVYLLGGYASANSTQWQRPPKKCASLSQPGCRSSPVDNWMLDTKTMKWAMLPARPGALTHPAGETKGFAVWRGRYIISVGVIGRGRSLTYPAATFGTIANDSILHSSLNDSCSPPLKGWGPNSYPNAITVWPVPFHVQLYPIVS